MWRVPKLPIGAHKVLGFLAEPLKQPKDTLLSFEDLEVSENLEEFEDWVCSLFFLLSHNLSFQDPVSKYSVTSLFDLINLNV